MRKISANDGRQERLRHAPRRWLVSALEPLLTGREITRREADCARWAAANPSTATYWFAGMVWQLFATLPADDPWRTISVRGRDAAGAIIEKGEPPPGRMGAWLAGVAMDSSKVGEDVIPRQSLDPSVDHGLIALAGGLSERAAQTLGMAAVGWREAAEILASDRAAMSPDLFGRATFDAGSAALRWAIWRRRVYVGRTDPFPMATGLDWLGRAQRLAAGEQIDVEGCLFEISTEKIDDSAHAELSGMVGGHSLFPPDF